MSKGIGKGASAVGKGASAVGRGIKSAPSAMFNAGAAAAHKFTDNADVIYQIFYSIALFILICIISIPSIAFFVIGLICYILLKDKLKGLKAL